MAQWLEHRSAESEGLRFGFPGKAGSRITGSRIKDQGSVENESNKLNKLIGMIDCSST